MELEIAGTNLDHRCQFPAQLVNLPEGTEIFPILPVTFPLKPVVLPKESGCYPALSVTFLVAPLIFPA